jgi:predicted MFS family arabinose efflux permease
VNAESRIARAGYVGKFLNRLVAEGGREGCLVIMTSALGVGVGLLGLPILTIGLFMAPLHADLGWTRAQISGASTCINLATICAAPFIGGLCDRFGVRRVALASLTSLMLGFCALAAMNASLMLYYGIWFVMSVGAVGTSGIVWTRAVGTFFERNRGQALGLALTGTAFAALLAPLTLGVVIADFGWRSGYLALGAVSLLTIPVAFLFFKERHDSGIAYAGEATIETSGASLTEATRDPKFWIIGSSIFLSVLGMGSFLVHFVPLAIDSGVQPVVAGRMFAIIGLSMLCGRIFIGTLLDRFDPIVVSSVALFVPTLVCCLLLLQPISPIATAAMSAALIGFSAGAEIDILPFLVARYFGLRSYGAIYGSELVFFAAGSGIGSILTGYVRDTSGTYMPALTGGILIFSLSALIMLLMRRSPRVSLAE